jgi:hypothetical protein
MREIKEQSYVYPCVTDTETDNRIEFAQSPTLELNGTSWAKAMD